MQGHSSATDWRLRVIATTRLTPTKQLKVHVEPPTPPRSASCISHIMSRRLLNRGRASGADSSPARTGSSSAALPGYEPPSCPLNDSARRALGELSNNRGTLAYETQLKDSVRHLGLSVSDLHERLLAQQLRLDHLRERRQERGSDKTQDEQRLENHLVELEKEVDELTHEAEQSVRDIIDHRAQLEDETNVLGDLYTNAATSANTHGDAQVSSARESRRRNRAVQEEDEPQQMEGEGIEQQTQDEREDQKEEPVRSTLEAFRDGQAHKQAIYEALTPYERYSVNNDYAGFKKLWHDAAAGEDGPPLADATRWFRSDGRPVMSRPGASHRRSTMGSVDADEDDDIAVAREVLSMNCPLTLRPMDEPYSNVKCKHTFEKAAILDYLPARGQVQCPQTGCSQVRTVHMCLKLLR